jgi:YD repeat-containing protein
MGRTTGTRLADNEYVRYVRDKNGKPIGVIYAARNIMPVLFGGTEHQPLYRYGYSLCAKCDEWNKSLGLTIAKTRAWAKPEKYGRILMGMPHTVNKEFRKFQHWLEVIREERNNPTPCVLQ